MFKKLLLLTIYPYFCYATPIMEITVTARIPERLTLPSMELYKPKITTEKYNEPLLSKNLKYKNALIETKNYRIFITCCA